MPRAGWFFLILGWILLSQILALGAKCPQQEMALPAHVHDQVVKAENLAAAGKYEEAARLLLQFVQKHPKERHAYVHYDLGLFFKQAGNWKEAARHLEKAADLNPCFVEALQLLAVLYQEKSRFKQAASTLEKAADILGDPEVLYQAAVFYIQAEKAEKAAGLLENLLEKHPKKAPWWAALATARQMLKKLATAATAMEKAAGLDNNPEYGFQAAVLYLEANQPKKALPFLEKLSKEKSPRPEWLEALSNALGLLKKKVETARAMEKAARISKNPDQFYHAAYLWLEADRPKNALKLLKRLARNKKPKLDWLLALANTHMTLDQIVDAAKVMERVVQMDDSPQYLYNAGVLWLQAEKVQKALPHLSRLCKIKPPKAEWFTALAHAHIKLDDIPKAADAMETAAKISGKPDHAYMAATLRLQLSQADKALDLVLPLVRLPRPKADWWMAVSNAHILKEAFSKAAEAMESAALISKKADHFFRAAQLWLQAENPEKALPLLKDLAQRPSPKAQWLVVLSNTCLMLKDNPGAAAAMERAAGISKKGAHYHRAAMLWRGENRLEKAARIC